MARPEGTKEEREGVRRRAIALLNNGYSPAKVAELANVTRQSVYRWKRNYKEKGDRGIRAIPNTGGRTPKLPKEKLPELELQLLKGPEAHGFDRREWSYKTVRDLIEQEFGVSVSASTARRYLLSINWSDKKLKSDSQNLGRNTDGDSKKKRNTGMQRVTLRVPKHQIEFVDRMVERGEFPNRSEAIRSAVREMLSEQQNPPHQASEDRKRTWAKV